MKLLLGVALVMVVHCFSAEADQSALPAPGEPDSDTEACAVADRSLASVHSHPRSVVAWIRYGRVAGCLYSRHESCGASVAVCEGVYAELLSLGTHAAITEVSGSLDLPTFLSQFEKTSAFRRHARTYRALFRLREHQDDADALGHLVAASARIVERRSGRVSTRQLTSAQLAAELSATAYWPPGAACDQACCTLSRSNDGDDNRGSCMLTRDVKRICFDGRDRVSRVEVEGGANE